MPNVVNFIPGDTKASDDAIYVVNHGWHTGFIIPADLIISKIPVLEKRFKNAEYIEFGWGDKGFYQSKEITSSLTLQAIFWPTDSVIHAVSIPTSVDKYYTNTQIAKICLTNNRYQALVEFIGNSFYRNNQNKIVILKSGIYGDSQFYQGVGSYYLMNTCNKWTAKGLKSAGMDISTTFKLTAGSVMGFISENNQNKDCIVTDEKI